MTDFLGVCDLCARRFPRSALTPVAGFPAICPDCLEETRPQAAEAGASAAQPVTLRRAGELIHDALDADDGRYGYHDRATGTVDTTSDELAAALLAAGWRPPVKNGDCDGG